MYLELFHGRMHPDDKLDDWGFDGPVLGPVHQAHVTYMTTLRIRFQEDQSFYDIPIHEGLIHFGKKYYGDWSIIEKDRINNFDKRILPLALVMGLLEES